MRVEIGHRMLIAFAVTILIGTKAPGAVAAAPQCHVYGSGGYCEYTGKVREAYINAYQEILMYFDAPVDPAAAASVGLVGVTVPHIARYVISGNPA